MSFVRITNPLRYQHICYDPGAQIGAPRAHEELLVQILHEIASSRAVRTEYTCSRERERCVERAWPARGGEMAARGEQWHV
eukprot:980561-Pleurochrysis_carterae.AAC.1